MRMSSTTRLRLTALEARDVPAGDLAFGLLLPGLSASANVRVAADPIGNTYVAGTFSGTIDLDPTDGVTNLISKGGTDVFVAKYGSAGQLVWAKSLGGTANDSVADITFDGAGNVYTAGTFQGAVDFNPDPNASAIVTAAQGGSGYVWKLDYYGNLFLARTIGGTCAINSLATDPRGNIAASGTFQGTADFDPTVAGKFEMTTTNATGAAFAWKLFSTGALGWAKKFETTGSIEAPAVAIDGTGYVYVGGRSTGTVDLDPSDAGKAQFAAGVNWMPFVVKLGNQGDYVWSKVVRTVTQVVGAPNQINGIGVDSIGNVYAAGVFAGALDFDPNAGTTALTSTGQGTDGFVWKLDPAGNLRWARRFGGASPETAADLYVDKAGFTYTTGAFTGVADFDPGPGTANLVSGSGASDAYILKLSSAGNLAYTRVIGGGVSTTRATGIWADGAGNMTLAGTFVGTADFDPSSALKPIDGGTGTGFLIRLSPTIGTTPGPTNSPPTNVSAGGPYTIKEGDGLTVAASATDFDKDELKYTWDLNGDGKFGDAVGRVVILTKEQMKALGLEDGTGVPKTIRVRVRDGVNMAAESVGSLTIQNIAPTAKLVAPAKGKEGVRPQIQTVPTGDPSAADLKAGMHYSYDFNDDGEWDLGDGSTYAGSVTTSTLKVPAAFVPDSGPIAVRVRVFDKDGGYVDRTATIDLENQAPTAVFAMLGGQMPRVGTPITFAFSNPQDSPHDKQAGFTYGFDFDNDGIFEVQGKNPAATFTFPFRGTFVIKGAIADQEGAFTVYTLTVNVPI
jgi:hypothetical protein